MLILLFGLAGSGKNFVAELLRDQFGFYFWDADEALTDSMKACIQQRRSFTQLMRDEFTEIIVLKIKALIKIHPKLVVTQALYKEQNRQHIHTVFPEALFIQIQADQAIIQQRLKEHSLLVDERYANQIKSNFEIPLLAHQTIVNNSTPASIISQLKAIFNHAIRSR